MNKKIVVLGLLSLFFITDRVEGQRHKKREAKKIASIYEVDTLINPIPRQRQSFHINIDKQQLRADIRDNAADGFIYYSEDTVASATLSKAILNDINHIQVMIENMPANGRGEFAENNEKIGDLRAVWELLIRYNKNMKVDPGYYKKLVINMRDLIIAENENRLMDFAKENANLLSIENGKELLKDFPEVRTYIYMDLGKKDPKMMIQRLNEFAGESFASDIVASAAKIVPDQVYNYATSSNYPLRMAVRKCDDPFVRTIVAIADKSQAPLKAMPFIYDIYNGTKTIEQVDAITADPDLFYQNLVRVKLENNKNGADTYSDELAYRGLRYVREMDDLHESQDRERFKCIDSMSPECLYYILVYGQDEIYTSSFLGTFKRMLEKMKPRTGDQFFDTLHYDHFRTFIRMCAGYNTLSSFLSTMTEDHKTQVMKDFIAGLEKGKEDDLEDAVDVADAFGSIRDSALATFLQQQVKINYEHAYKEGSKKGLIIYSLLSLLFDGTRSTTTDAAAFRQSERLGLPSISLVPYKSLLGDSSTVFEQFFFFGDEDGKNSYNSFLTNFRNDKRDIRWKIKTEKYWTVITSLKGKHIVIYANLPIPEPADEEAQTRLCDYLDSNNIHPSIMVHRGHSYHLPLTLDKLDSHAKIVMLGSCGGYHNLAVVLDHSPDAHIISSKQTGAMAVNEPIIKAINTELLEGHDINWIKMWRALGDSFTAKKEKDVLEKFDDYVPPYRNLGAIFIKAYRRMADTDEDE